MPIAEPDSSTVGPFSAAAIASEISVVPFVRLSSELALVLVGPALVADAGAGEMDDGVDAVERVGVDPALGGRPEMSVPVGLPRTTRIDLVAERLEVRA